MTTPARPVPTFEQALTDPAIFGAHFAGPSWEPHRVIARALDGLPLSPEQRAIFEVCAKREPPTERVSELWGIKGRRIGGSLLFGGALGVHTGCFGDFQRRLAPGERATIMLLCADRRQSRTLIRYCHGLLESPLLAPLVESQTAEGINLTTRATIEIHTSNFRSVRGYAIALAVCDELAFWEGDDASANPADEVLQALRPALASLGGRLVCLSSPHARRGPLWEAFSKGFGQNDPHRLVIHAPTPMFNPTIDPAIIERALTEDESAARAEWFGEFRRDLEPFVSREALEAVTVSGRLELPPAGDVRYTAFVDPSGGSADSFTLAISHENEHGIGVLDLVREVRPPFSPEAVVEDFAAILRTYRIDRVTGDAYGGEWPRDRFRTRGIAYDLSSAPKSELYRQFLARVNSRHVELLDLPRLAGQMVQLERRTGRSGRDTIDHAPSRHDDVANACAGVLVERRPVRLEIFEAGSSLPAKSKDDEQAEHDRDLAERTRQAERDLLDRVMRNGGSAFPNDW